MRRIVWTALIAGLAGGCGDSHPGATKPDNTGINERDQGAATKTPLDQAENQADVDRTAEIRRRVMAKDDLSTNGKNVKIITANGKVTLRGPVASEEERNFIAQSATDVAGAGNVDNQLEVTK